MTWKYSDVPSQQQTGQMRLSMSKVARFTWKTTDGASHDFELVAAEISIGRAPTCDIVLPDDQMVSRRHAIVRRQGDIVTVVDLGSSNGTLINGVEIHDAAPLKDGDRLTIGDQELLFALTEAQPVFVTPGFNSTPANSFNNTSNSGFGASNMPVFGGTPAYPQQQPSSFSGPIAPQSPFGQPGPFQPDLNPFEQQDTGAMVSGQAYSFYSHTVDGTEVEHQESVSDFQTTYSEPQHPDAASLLASIQALHNQLNEEISMSNDAADRVRTSIRTILQQLDAALGAAHSASQQTALADLQSLASNVSQSPLVDQVASFARRAGEIRDVLTAHQQLLASLDTVRQQLVQTLNS
jgi:predicted component of type VI protein secretion system